MYLYLLCGLVLCLLSVKAAYPGGAALGWVGVGLFGVLCMFSSPPSLPLLSFDL